MSLTLAHTDDGWTIAADADRLVASFRRGGRVCAALDGDGAREWLFRCVEIGDAGPDRIDGSYAADPGGPAITLRETIRRRGTHLLSIARRWENRGGATLEFVPVMEAVASYAPSFWLIPCVNYDGNDWGTGWEPKGMMRDGRPWVYAYRRIGIPSATFSENEAWCVGLFADPDDPVSLTSSASLLPGDGASCIASCGRSAKSPCRTRTRTATTSPSRA